MNYLSNLTLIAVFISAMSFVSCSEKDNAGIEYFPFQETEDGLWGMISMDGRVLFSEEFKNTPTVVTDGRFFVRNNDGYWEMFAAKEKPEKIGNDYVYTSGFNNGRALVTEKGKPVSIIDTDGKQIKLIDKINGKVVDGVKPFHEDCAVFVTVDTLFGVIDKNGDCVVKPEYCSLNFCSDGKFIGMNAKYKNMAKEKSKYSVIDKNGKVLFEFSANKYEDFSPIFSDGMLSVCVKKEGKRTMGIINDEGETVVKPTEKIKAIGEIHGENFTYNNGEGWGLMNIKGETLIRAKYDELLYDKGEILIAGIRDGGAMKYKYITVKDKQIGDETYISALSFSSFDGKHTLVKPNDKMYSIIDKDCRQMEGLPDISDISIIHGDYYVKSDYVDMQKLVDEFKVSEDGILGISINTMPKDAVKIGVDLGLITRGSSTYPATSPYWYDYTSQLRLFKNTSSGIIGVVEVSYPYNMSKQTYRTKQVVDFTWGYTSYYHNERIPTGYVWNDCTPNYVGLLINNEGKMRGKLRDLYQVLYRRFKPKGSVVKENDNAAIMNIGGGDKQVLVFITKDLVSVAVGNKDYIEEKFNIDQFKEIKEDVTIDSDGEVVVGSEAVDSAVVDSAVVEW